jgi:integrase
VRAHLGRRRARRGRPACPRPARAAQAGRGAADRAYEVGPGRPHGAAAAGGARGAVRGRGRFRVRTAHAPRTPLSRHNAARTIREAGERAKLGYVTPHVLRRTTGTALSEARVPEAAAAAILGHSIEVSTAPT